MLNNNHNKTTEDNWNGKLPNRRVTTVIIIALCYRHAINYHSECSYEIGAKAKLI